MIFIIGGREQGKTAYAMKLWEKRTLERRKTKDLSTVLNRSKNPEACRVTARIADGRLETDEQTIMQADLITHFELFVRREMEAGRDPYVFAERLMQENPDAFVGLTDANLSDVKRQLSSLSAIIGRQTGAFASGSPHIRRKFTGLSAVWECGSNKRIVGSRQNDSNQ